MILEAPSYPCPQSLAIDKSYSARTSSNAFFSDINVMALFGCVDKPAEKHYSLICYEKKILF
jgi:hypothetical protein